MDPVRVTDGMDIWARSVDGGVDVEACGVDRTTSLSTASSEAFATAQVHEDHVGGFEHAEMDAERVDPEGVGVDGIAHRDVAREALGVAVAGEDPEGAREVLELPLAFGFEVGDGWAAWVWVGAVGLGFNGGGGFGGRSFWFGVVRDRLWHHAWSHGLSLDDGGFLYGVYCKEL